MNPPVPDELISAYFDGEVSHEELGQVERLLEDSAESRQFLDDTAKLSALLHSFPRESAPETLAANVQRRVDAAILPTSPAKQPVRQSLRREMTAFATGILATVASLIAVYVSIDHSQSGRLDHDDAYGLASRSPAAGLRYQRDFADDMAVGHGVNPDSSNKFGESLARASAAAPTDGLESMPAQELAVREMNGVPYFDGNGLFLNGARTEPVSTEELMTQLKNGDVFLRTSLDPNNTVVVVEFTVVDVNKGEEEMQVVLQQRNVPQVESEQLLQLNERVAKKDVNLAKRKRVVARDGLVVFYVRAHGSELASTLADLRQHSELYKNPETQLPIELPAGGISNSVNTANTDTVSDVAVSHRNAGKNSAAALDQTPVALEANIVTNLYANKKGMRIDESEDAIQVTQDKADASLSSFAKKERDFSREEKQPMARSMSPRVESTKSNFGTATVNASQSPLGYSMFHVAVDKELQQRALGGLTNDNKNYSYQLPAMMNTTNQTGLGNQSGIANFSGTQNQVSNSLQIGNMGQMSNNGVLNNSAIQQQWNRNNNPRHQVGRMNTESREAQLMRMLIVLKSADAPADHPEP